MELPTGSKAPPCPTARSTRTGSRARTARRAGRTTVLHDFSEPQGSIIRTSVGSPRGGTPTVEAHIERVSERTGNTALPRSLEGILVPLRGSYCPVPSSLCSPLLPELVDE